MATDLLRPRRSVPRHRRRRGPARGRRRAFTNDPGGATAYGTAIGYMPLRAWIAEQHGVDEENVSSPTARCRPTPSSSTSSSSPATPSSSSARPTTARCSACASAARTPPGRARARRHRRRRARAAARRRRPPEARPHHPQLPEPGRLHALARQARRAARARRDHDFLIFEDDPYVELRFDGRAAADHALDGRRASQRRLRVVVLEDRLPGHPRRLPRRPARADRAHRQARDEHLHLAEHGRPVDRLRVLRAGAIDALDRDGQGRAAERVELLAAR